MRAIRFGIGVCVAFAVLAHGAVETWATSVLVICAAALFLVWGVLSFREPQPQIRWNPLLAPLLALAGLALLQYATPLSVYPFLTKVALLKLAAYTLLFFLAVQSLRRAEEFRGLIWFLLAFGFAVAVFGIIQYFTYAGKLYWFRELRHGGTPFGPFVNRNHFAGLMELLIPPGLAMLLLRGVRRDQRPLLGVLAIVPIAALVLSASRGGILSFLFQFGLLGLLVAAAGASRRRLAFATGILLVAGSFAVWLGTEFTLARFVQTSAEELAHGRRLAMVKDSWRIFLDYPVAGTGLGTLVAVYPRYESYYDGKMVEHAHNDFIELMAETGLIGTLCGLAFLVLLFRTAFSNLGAEQGGFALAVRLGALVSCAGLLLHGLVDFNLHIPSNALVFFLMAAFASSRFDSPPAA